MADRPLQSIQDTLRIPFYQTENAYNAYDASQLFNQININLIPQYHMDHSSDAKEQTLLKRPGLAKISSSDFMTGIVDDLTSCVIMDAIPISALYDVFVVAVFDNSTGKIYIIMARPFNQTYVKMGSISSTSLNDYCFLTEYTQASGGSTFPAVAISWTNEDLTLSKGYYATSGSGVFAAASLTEITDTDFPPKQTPGLITLGRFVWLNSLMFIPSIDGRIWNSATNDISTWNGGVIAAQAYPDQIIGLARYKHHIVAFGRNSIEFFNDVGADSDITSPLASTQQAFIKFGAKSPRMIRNMNDVLYWVGYGSDNAIGLWMLDGYTPVKLSTPYIDIFIANFNQSNDAQNINMQVTTMGSKPIVVLNGINEIGTPAINTMPAFASTYPTGTVGTDTYPLEVTDFQSNIWCYNVEDKTWFALNLQGDPTVWMIGAGTEFANPSQTAGIPGYYTQIVLYNQQDPSSGGTRRSQQYLYTWGNDANEVLDETSDSSASNYPNVPVTTVAQTNTFWFGNEKRKRVNKSKVLLMTSDLSHTSDVTSMYTFYLRDQNIIESGFLNNLQTRGCEFPNDAYRYYINNLGTGRAWSFAVVEKSKQPLLLKALEVDIQQNSH